MASKEHLTYFERCEIQRRWENHESNPVIGKALDRASATIWRELKRNSKPNGRYCALTAQLMANARKGCGGAVRKLDHAPLREYVQAALKEEWSPEQIAGRLPLEHPQDQRMRVSYETIYTFVYEDKRKGGELYKHLRQAHKKRRKRASDKGRRGVIRDRVPIEERPEIVDAQTRPGDWEGDTVIGRGHKAPIATFVERATLYTTAARMPDKRAASLNKAATAAFATQPGLPLHTLTVDNGKEFSDFKELEETLDVDIYFARPYRATDRAINENINGLLRQYLPKGSDFTTLTDAHLNEILRKLNNRPRKKLGYSTPVEVLRERGIALHP